MGTSHPNRRLGRTAAGILVAVGAVGTTTAAVVAYADNQPAAATGTTITDNTGGDTGTGTGNTDQSSGTSGSVPELSPGSGTAHARSSGS
ncbi:hypothetical protein IRT45_16755 [Nocardia sp. BSTN01]|uniref:hypothetical protein n=1 Tax=Nocardia sp. BSTN01 TaxID=2783665 RepID=UPI0018903DA0|nr:hypothetical protein [Nocardia sp. BSTN01]MBF4998798.1 hypothetical protein [Nocardia sp. BSTN01]